eukprot:TRINITY_DN13969_c0_g1_i1.p2 TRINITY_DN13969_c0_g1~~TRINITY_DN13969_c0_g1_i1.p2  ORF type:complete len:110 (+),score=19.71 TRINITY_DN13969_c0_g1_i1:65-394(+)
MRGVCKKRDSDRDDSIGLDDSGWDDRWHGGLNKEGGGGIGRRGVIGVKEVTVTESDQSFTLGNVDSGCLRCVMRRVKGAGARNSREKGEGERGVCVRNDDNESDTDQDV